MLAHAKLPKTYRVEALKKIVNVIKISPSTPLESDIQQRLWTAKDVSYLIEIDHLVRSATTESWKYVPNQKMQKTVSNVETQDITWKTHNSGKNHDSPQAVK